MQTEVVSIISAAIGAAISVISVYNNNRSHENKEKIRSDKEYKLEELRLDRKEKKENKANLLKKIERANFILCEFEHKISLTRSVIDTSSKLEAEDYDVRYNLETSELNELQSIAIIYLQEIMTNVTNLVGLHNIYWGHQRLLLKTDILSDRNGFSLLQREIIEISNKKNGEINEIRDKISSIAENFTKI